MPTRPPAHQLETESRVAFQALLPSNWLFRDKTPDYGIDGDVELFDDSHKSTGDQFLVQLKATGRKSKPLIALEIEWIKYYSSLELPVLLTLWVKKSKETFWMWARDIDLYYARPKAKFLTVHLSNRWDSRTPSQIQRQLQFRRRLKSQDLREPLKVAVEASARPALHVHLQTLCAYAPHLLTHSQESPDVTCTLDRNEFRISFSGFRGTVLHSVRKAGDVSLARFAVVGIVISLANFGAVNKAAELWISVPNLYQELYNLDIASRVIAMLIRASAYAELRALVAALAPKFGRVMLALPIHAMHFSAPPHRRAQLTDLLIELQHQELKEAPPGGKSNAHYSIARLYEHTNRRKAMHHFSEAIRASKFYRNKAYFWDELGAFLFSNSRYRAALCCYRHAYKRLGRLERRTYYADALLHTGQYKEALREFRSIVAKGKKHKAGKNAARDKKVALDMADATLKVRALTQIKRVSGVDTQTRQRGAAREALGNNLAGASAADVLVRTEAAIRADALSNHAWFNRGLVLDQTGKAAEALESFVTAASVLTGDNESWLKALLHAQRLDPRLMPALLVYLTQHGGENFSKYLADVAQGQTNDAGRQMLSGLAKLFAEAAGPPDDPILRVYGKGGKRTVLRAHGR